MRCETLLVLTHYFNAIYNLLFSDEKKGRTQLPAFNFEY